MIYPDILETIGNTPLVELRYVSPNPDVRIFAKLEGQNPGGSVKDRIAYYMIKAAEESRELTPERIILEATSGNTGIALAMVGVVRGYKVRVVMPDNLSEERTGLLQAFGADVIYSDGAKGTNGAIAVAQKMLEDDPVHYMPWQFGNPNNPRAHYETTGPEIIRDLPDLDVFVAGLGTGGTLTGVGRRLKEHNPDIKIIAAAPHPGDMVQGLRSLEDGFVPEVLDESGARRPHPRRLAHFLLRIERAAGPPGHLRGRLFGSGAARRPAGRAADEEGEDGDPPARWRLEVSVHRSLEQELRRTARRHRRKGLVVGRRAHVPHRAALHR